MLRFFRSKAPIIALLLLVVFVSSFPEAKSAGGALILILFVFFAYRAFASWKKSKREELSLDDQVSRSAGEWDRRYEPPDEIEYGSIPEENEDWRDSLPPSDSWKN